MSIKTPLILVCITLLLCACQTGVRPDRPTSDTALVPLVPTQPEQIITAALPEPAEITNEPSDEQTFENNDSPDLDSGAAVFARLKSRLSPNACDAGENALRWRNRYAQNPSQFAQHLENILPLLDFVSLEVERNDQPAEFALIPIVESWYRPDAIGGGAGGMWQMIDSTARNHGVHITPGYDGRLSPVESTRAALSYLDTLSPMFDDWQSTVMAYNAGEYRILGAFKRNGSREVSAETQKPRGLSTITYDYVAKLQALACLITEPERQGLQLPLSAHFIPLSPVLVHEDITTLDQLADSFGMPVADLRKLNPGYKAGRIMTNVPRSVLMPISSTFPLLTHDSPEPLEQKIEAKRTDTTTPDSSRHQVRSGDSLSAIAKRYRISLAQLFHLNGLNVKSVLRPGQWLKIAP